MEETTNSFSLRDELSGLAIMVSGFVFFGWAIVSEVSSDYSAHRTVLKFETEEMRNAPSEALAHYSVPVMLPKE